MCEAKERTEYLFGLQHVQRGLDGGALLDIESAAASGQKLHVTALA
jgi:hypothetical protein